MGNWEQASKFEIGGIYDFMQICWLHENATRKKNEEKWTQKKKKKRI